MVLITQDIYWDTCCM